MDEPEISAINARRALEWMARAIYQMKGVAIGERWSLFQIVDSDLFRDFIADDRLMMAVHYIRKIGNAGAHDNSVSKKESFFALLNLYNFIGAVLLKLRVLATLKPFDKTLIPNSAITVPTKPVAVETIEEFTETVEPEQVEAATENAEGIEQQLSWNDISEAETRRLFIDLMLREAGWEVLDTDGDKQPGKACVEIEVSPMPNKENKGYADYVLFGDDARPLAVIEAKRTSKDPESGRHQAELYANALEAEYGVRPVIYFTNGYETWIIDGLGYPKRKLLAFHSKEDLARIIKRRGRHDVADMTAKGEIAGRHYQVQGIKALCEHFNKKHRRGLLVMATGTGKTRTAIALVDVLSRAGWVKNTLFLADRTSLVIQAHKNFEKLLPNSYTMTVLSDRTKDPDMNARITFSTYQTMLNHVDTEEKSYSVGHFDLIIIDEAHRSVFGKLGSTLKYFDSLVVGLTATPRDQVDKSTYDLLQLEGGEPNYAYEYEEAVQDGYLVDYVGLQRGSAVVRQGIRYDDLSQAEKDQLESVWEYEATLSAIDDGNGIPRDIQSSEIYKYIFNIDTVDKVLQDLMTNGLKIHSGETIGKTIIFAFNKEHAKLIVERFHALYPDYGAEFCQRIDYSINYAQDIIEKFEVRDKMPQIAVSVDMLDTGIDVPDILNLVFFKRVRSKIKFNQMIGRGTRLSPDIFGFGKDKEQFLIFDWCGNFEYFNKKMKQPKEGRMQSLSEKLFGVRADIACALQTAHYQSDDFAKEFHDELKQILLGQAQRLNDAHISVRDHWEAVSRFRIPQSWEYISAVDVLTLKNEVVPLVSSPNEDESALKFDLLALNIQLGLVDPEYATDVYEGKITLIASALQKLGSVPEVMAKMDTIDEVLTPEFWENKSLSSLERIRIELRDLIKHLVGGSGKIFIVDIEDTVTDEGIAPSVVKSVTYKKKVIDFLAENREHPVLKKIQNIEQLSETDIDELERILWQELGTKEDYDRYLQRENLTSDLSVGAFIRTLSGVDRAKALQLFTEFIQANSLTVDQEEYLFGITINSPWYASVWAWIIYILLSVGLVVFAIYYYLDRQKQKLYVAQIRKEADRQYQLNEMKLRFFTNVSHDFRTPLSLIITPLEAFMSDEANKNSVKYLKPVYKNAVRLLNLINQILDFRKIDVNGAVLNLSYGDIVSFLKDICSSFTLFAEDTGKQLIFSSEEKTVNMYFDKDKVTKIMMNLLSNSFKFTKAGTDVSVHMKITGDDIFVSVADNGPGVPDDRKERIFDRFYQSESSSSDHLGSGIGLHIVKEFVTLHNGSITVSDNRPTGAVFTFSLPVIKAVDRPEESVTESLAENRASEYAPDDPAGLLLVEDNADFREFMKNQLSDEYNVFTASNGREALDLLEKHEIRIIVSDVMMDGMDGLELCRKVKSNLTTSHIPVILLTAKALAEDEMLGFECGADEYVTKPFNMPILRRRISKIIADSLRSQQKFKEKLDVNPSEVTITSFDEQFLSNAINCVETNMASPDFSVETMSSMLGVHRTQLYKKLVNLTGKTPVEFIRLIRLKRAAQYLAKSQMFISEIAYTVGFGSPKIFSRHFKDEFGMSPRDFQNEHSGTDDRAETESRD